MQYGIQGGPLLASFPYCREITQAADECGVSPLLLGAIAWRETLGSTAWLQLTYGQPPNSVVSHDGGHGIFQLTSPVPDNWSDPYANAKYACTEHIIPSIKLWTGIPYKYTGTELVRCVAASFNAGDAQAQEWHEEYGDVDAYTTRADGIPYGIGVLNNYLRLCKNLLPNPT
jgi:hypothetical protein